MKFEEKRRKRMENREKKRGRKKKRRRGKDWLTLEEALVPLLELLLVKVSAIHQVSQLLR